MINYFTNSEKSSERKLIKSKCFENKVIITNGFNASGKTLYSPIVGSIKNVELMSFLYELEWASAIFYAEKMCKHSYQEFVKMCIDHLTYNQQMSRCTNFRFNDLSSVFRSSKKFMYFCRLFTKGDNDVLPKISYNGPITNITTCHLFPVYPTIRDALKDRLLFIETIRDPIYMFNQLLILHQTILNDKKSKDFTFRSVSNGIDLTYLDFFSSSNTFIDSNNQCDSEFVVSYLERMFEFYFNTSIDLYKNNNNLLVIPFEHFVISPFQYVNKILKFTNQKLDKNVIRQLKIQKVPRQLLTDGRSLNIYKRFGWSSNSKNIKNLNDEDISYRKKIISIIDNTKISNRLIELSDKYKNFSKSLYQYD